MDEIMFIEGLVPENVIEHVGRSKMDGAKVGSGRYPLGSGANPYHHGRLLGKFSEKRQAKRKAQTTAERMENMRAAKAAKAEKARAEAQAKVDQERAAAEREERKKAAIKYGKPEEIAPFVAEMSTQEITEVKNRLQAMLDLNDVMVKKDPSYGKTRAQKAMIALERANKNTNTIVDTYNNLARIVNALRGTSFPIIPPVNANQNKNKGNGENNTFKTIANLYAGGREGMEKAKNNQANVQTKTKTAESSNVSKSPFVNSNGPSTVKTTTTTKTTTWIKNRRKRK